MIKSIEKIVIKNSWFLILMVNFNLLFAQNIILSDTLKASQELTKLSLKIKNDFKPFINNLSQSYPKSKQQKIAKSIYESRSEFALNLIKKGYIIVDESYRNYISSIFQQIANANNLEAKNYNILLSRDYIPNASSMGDGLFLVHINLINLVDNESQLAFIIGHEMAHDQLKHVESSIKKKITLETSEEIKKKAAAIKKTKYNKTNILVSELKNILYEDGKIDRKKEVSADSLSYYFLKKTNYNATESVNSLKKLDLLDKEPDSLSANDIKQYFDLPNFPFDANWLNEEDFSSYTYHKENVYGIHEDSLKTHPEIDKRIELLKQFYPELKSTKSSFQPINKTFDEFKTRTRHETIQSLYYLEDIGLSLYEILKQLKKYPQDQWLWYMIGENLTKLTKAKKGHYYNRYVDQIDFKNHSKSYVRFLNFLNNLQLSEIEEITKFYKSKYPNP